MRDALIKIEVGVLCLLMLFQLATCVHGFVASARAPIVPKGERFTCTADRVWDGDGPIWCTEGWRIRLARINARELDGSCRPRAPCPVPSGIAARDHLVQLLGGATGTTRDGHITIKPVELQCLSDGWGKGDRTAAWCTIGGKDLSESMVGDGFAARWLHPRPN